MLKKLLKTLWVVVAMYFIVPVLAFANVKISEVAWMGNDKSSLGEWIELYNDGSTLVDLKDAALYEAGGTILIIKLTKAIDPGGYYLVARSTPSVPDPVSGLADDLGSFGGSGLSNSGENLVLKSATGDLLDSIDATSGWPAGGSTSKLTMQLVPTGTLGRSGGSWITATATPRLVNFITVVDSNTNLGNSTTTDQTGNNLNNNSGSTTNPLDNESGALSAHTSQAALNEVKEDIKTVASAGRDRLTLVDTPIVFESKVFTTKGDSVDGGNVSWSFGDGEAATGKIIIHTYKFAGDYAVVMNVARAGEDFVARTNVRVVSGELKITSVGEDSVKIKNSSSYEVNLGGWQVVAAKANFTFPKDTIVMPKKEIAVAKEILGFLLDGDIKLISPAKKTVSTFNIKKEVSVATTSPDRATVVATTTEVAHEAMQPNQTVATVLLGARQQLLNAQKFLEQQKQSNVNLTPKSQLSLGSSAPKEELDLTVEQKIIEVIPKPKSFFQYIRSWFY